jgi:hypothetical protein
VHPRRGRGRRGRGDGERENHDQRDHGYRASSAQPATCSGVDAKTSNGSIRLGEVAHGSIVLGTPAGDLEIGIAEGSAARLAVSTGHGHVRNLPESATGREEADEIVEVHARTSYGDITIHRF